MAQRFTIAALSRPRAGWLLRTTLLSTALLDELTTGFFVVGLPLVRDMLRLSYTQAGLLFSAGELSSLLIEPIVNLLSDRGSKRVPIVGGMLVLVAAFALAGVAPSFVVLVLAFALLFPANGAAVSLSQAALIDQAPEAAERTMTRWTFVAGIGDLFSPLVVAAVLSLGQGWRALSAVGALIWLGTLLFVWPQPFPRAAGEMRTEGNTLRESVMAGVAGVRAAMGDRRLLRWTGVVLLTAMLDEVFLGFAGLFLRDVLHASAVAISLALAAHMVGGLLGLLALDRLLRRIRGSRILPALAAITLAGVAVLLLAPAVWLAGVALFLIGLGAAGWYPIAQAAAYATQPNRSGTVQAVTTVFGAPFGIALPAVVGLVAGRFGIAAAIALLGLAPIGVVLLAPRRPTPIADDVAGASQER